MSTGWSNRVISPTPWQWPALTPTIRPLGTPKAGREAARAGRIGEMREIFEGSLAEPEAQVQLQQAERLATEAPAALLCFEADAAHCHRRIVAEYMQRDADFEVVDL